MNKLLMWLLLGLGLLPLFSACSKETVEDEEPESHVTGNIKGSYYVHLLESRDADEFYEIERHTAKYSGGYVVYIPAEGGTFRFDFSPQAERVTWDGVTDEEIRIPLSTFKFRLMHYWVGKWDSNTVPETIRNLQPETEIQSTTLLREDADKDTRSVCNEFFDYWLNSNSNGFQINFAPNDNPYELEMTLQFSPFSEPYTKSFAFMVIQGAKE